MGQSTREKGTACHGSEKIPTVREVGARQRERGGATRKYLLVVREDPAINSKPSSSEG